jgi:cobalt/nickel transport system permease protein
MHISDGFLSPSVWATLDAVSLPAIGWMARRARRDTDDRQIPLLGVMGAFVFAAQMINFPVGVGTSGHLVGGALLAMILGPAAACVVMTAIVALQAFVFQDGGIVVMGANVFNMALAGVFAGYLPYKLWGARWRAAAIFAGGALSVMVSACLALSQLLLSGVQIPGRVLWLSLSLFLVSASIEGAITLSAVRAIERLRSGFMPTARPAGSRLVGVIAIAAVLLAAIGVLAASAAPDGVQQLAAQIGLRQHSPDWLKSPFSGYQVEAISSEWLRKAAAALAGIAIVYMLCLATGRLLLARQARRNA